MNGRLAVDFGTSNTLFAVWDENRKDCIPLYIPDYGTLSAQDEDQLPFIPSLIHYAEDGRRWLGHQVLDRDLNQKPGTFRWMKRYINLRSPLRKIIDGRDITPSIAGQDFLSTLLIFALENLENQDEEVAFSVPVESFEHYQNWLTQVADKANIKRFRFIDEPSAAALGYGTSIQPGHAYLIFDMGGGTMHSSVVLIEEYDAASNGRRCRVLGKAGKEIGGTTIDQWIFERVLNHLHRNDYDDAIRLISNQLLLKCEQAKESLSFQSKAEISLRSEDHEIDFQDTLTRTDLEDLLDQKNLYAEINACIRSALRDAKERGYDEDSIHQVLMVGGASRIPSIQRSVRQMFGNERVKSSHPMDAVVRGAAAFVGGVDFFDHIQHDYAIRHIDAQSGNYEYRVIVKKGTSYPTTSPIAELAVRATYDGQQKMGIMIYEISHQTNALVKNVELAFDPSGAARLMRVSPDQEEERSRFWMNEDNPTFLVADPPANKGQIRFNISLFIDANKRLTISARDTISGRLLLDHFPAVKLI